MLVVNHVSPIYTRCTRFRCRTKNNGNRSTTSRNNAACSHPPRPIKRRVPLPNSRPLLKSCHSFSSSTHRIFTIRVNYSYYCWGTTHATSLCRRGRAVEPAAGRMKVLGRAGVSYRYEKQLISVNPVCLATPNYPWNNRGA